MFTSEHINVHIHLYYIYMQYICNADSFPKPHIRYIIIEAALTPYFIVSMSNDTLTMVCYVLKNYWPNITALM